MYINGTPPHHLPSASQETYDPNGSSIFVVEYERFKAMSAAQVLRIFQDRHILVINAPHEQHKFDKEGLNILGSLSIPREVQGIFNFFQFWIKHSYLN